GELAHRPEAAAVHRRIDAARVGKDAREAEVALVVDVRVVGCVERFELDPGHGREEPVALGLSLLDLLPPLARRVERRTVFRRRHPPPRFYAPSGCPPRVARRENGLTPAAL